jgi:ABC-type nitrate/sulfonate/bicarbonate transport system substrate-binding protein
MAGPTIKTVAQLKGKKIGAASPIDVYTYVIKEILKKAGLDPDTDVDFVFGGGQNQRLTAIVGGAIDAGLFTPPGDARLASQGFNTLAFTPDYFPNLTLSVTTVRRDWAQANGDTLRRFLRAQSDAVKWLDNPANKDRAIAILVDQTKAAPADAADAYDYYVGKAHVFPDNACVHVPGLTNVVKIMRITNQLKTIGPADVPKFTDTEWCPK